MSSNMGVVVGSEVVGAGFVRVSKVELINNIISMGEVHGRSPLVLFIRAFIASPANIIKKLTGGPALQVKLGVENLTNLILNLAIDLNRLRRRVLVVGEPIGSRRFNLRHMEDRMNETEFMRKVKLDRVATDSVDDFVRTEVRFCQLACRVSGLDMFHKNKDLVTHIDWRSGSANLVGGALITILHTFERSGEHNM